MLFDTDILIWVERGNAKAARLLDGSPERAIAVQTYLELVQGARDKRHLQVIRRFLRDHAFKIVSLSEGIGHRAAVYIEAYALPHGMRAADALIAATATETGLTLCTSNSKHFKFIPDLDLKVFKPD